MRCVQAKVRLSMSGGSVLGPVVDVVDFAEVAGHVAAGCVQPRSLACRTILWSGEAMRLVRPSHRARPVMPSKMLR